MRRARHVAAAVIRRGDEVVLVLQGAAGEQPRWSLPGGVVEDDELVPEGLVREVFEETGLRIEVPARIAYLSQIDNRQQGKLRGRPRGSSLTTIWVFEVDVWAGELAARDPDGYVTEARWVPLGEAAEWLRQTTWLEIGADYLEGRVARGSLHFERWNEDGSVVRALP